MIMKHGNYMNCHLDGTQEKHLDPMRRVLGPHLGCRRYSVLPQAATDASNQDKN